jgi:DNA polymerase III subunit beta
MEEGELALPASRFYSIVREMPDKSLIIEQLSGGRGAMLRASGYEFKILGEDPREFPEIPVLSKDGAVSIPREPFIEILRRVAVAASRDVSRFQLMGVYFELEGEKLIFTATDGKRLTNDFLRIENPAGLERSAIVPNRVVDVLLKVLAQGEADFLLSMQDPNLHVDFGRGQLTAKLIEGLYPDYRVAIPQEVKVRVTAKRIDLLHAAKSAALMTDKLTASVNFQFQEGKASLNTQASDIGESRIEVPISLQGDPLEVRFNPAYFIDALRCLIEEEIQIEFFDAEKPGAVRGGQHYRHLVMPVVTARS